MVFFSFFFGRPAGPYKELRFHSYFITRCKHYKRDSINQHKISESYKVTVIKFNANGQKSPQNSEGAKALRALNQLTVNRTPPFHIGPCLVPVEF